MTGGLEINFDLILGIYGSAFGYAVLILILIPGYLYSLTPGYKNTFQKIKEFLGYKDKSKVGLVFEVEQKTLHLLDYVIYGIIIAAFGTILGTIIVLSAHNFSNGSVPDYYDLLLWITAAEYFLLLSYFLIKYMEINKKNWCETVYPFVYGLGVIIVSFLLISGFFSSFQPYSFNAALDIKDNEWRDCEPQIKNCVDITIINLETTPIILKKVEFIGTDSNSTLKNPLKIEPYETARVTLEYSVKSIPKTVTFKIYDFSGFPRTIGFRVSSLLAG